MRKLDSFQVIDLEIKKCRFIDDFKAEKLYEAMSLNYFSCLTSNLCAANNMYVFSARFFYRTEY